MLRKALGQTRGRLGGVMFFANHQAGSHARRRLAALGLLLALGVTTGACQSTSASNRLAATDTTSSIAGTGEASIKQTARTGQGWRADPGNVELGLAYAANLQALGQFDDQLKVLDELARRNPDDIKLAAYHGKQLTHHGRAADGERALRRVVDSGQADWTVHSALGSALDQQGKSTQARQQYAIAIEAGGNKLTVLNNIGMSYVLEGDLAAAEAALREASRLPGGDVEPRLRQNLALVVGLQGRFDEAREIASRDLPPESVEANLAYLREMLSQPNTWQQLQPAAS
jgi:Flp pilus assembly protein TadD